MTNKYEWSTLLLRVVLGITFFVHGLVKFQGGIENTVGWFDSIGIPGFMAYVVALIELVGGVALIIGFGTKIVSALLAIVMLGAILKVKLAAGFLGNGQMAGYELDLVLLVMAVFLAVNDSKMLSLDQVVFKGKEQQRGQTKAV
ncbi:MULTISPECIES: DoxX family protein [Metabacillus]|jgi:putative oxidoreductase|uniref:DoxX family protein n=1 Tax=Metabacillus rhizolycopersici TaxID=2875709 RepID=A0ABS7UR90_9BACI|nr:MULTISPECIES: DoxX family protein [Metabacillus]MBZ5750569.1 DoxX family protein [Metabacillus rhizolycopersici]MCM3651709.1 DoxX family protein [Metabacillus litoralis]